jgi:DNA-binding NarL/FixJ family response regulator
MHRVLVVCHHSLVLSALTDLLAEEPSTECVESTDSAEAAIKRISRPSFDAYPQSIPGADIDTVLVDMDMPGLEGMRVAWAVREFLPQARLVLMSAIHDPGRLCRVTPDAFHPLVETATIPDLLRSMTREFPLDQAPV